MFEQKVNVTVHCYAGYRAEEQPRSFIRDEEKHVIIELLECWIDPEYRYFKVMDEDNRHYLLRYHTKSDSWELDLDKSKLIPDATR